MLYLNNINLYNPLILIKNNENDQSGKILNLKYKYNYSHDVVDFKNRNTVSFSGQKLSKALEYIQEVKNRYEAKGFKPNSFDDFNLYKLDGLLEGTVFDGISMEDFSSLCSSIENIILIRGCSNGCIHCLASAKPFKQGVTGEVGTIIWEDFKNLTDSINEIQKRLEFNPFGKYKKEFLPFHDSDPMSLKSYDNTGNPHNITEAVKYFYDKTEMPFHITTAGWDKEEGWVQKAAEELVENTLKISDSITAVMISVHPFHKYMSKSIEFEKASKKVENIGKKDLLEEKSQQYRQKYVDRMANVLKTFLPLFKENKASINLLYAPYHTNKSEYNPEVSIQLFKEIFDKLKKICKPEEFSNQDKQNFLNNWVKINQIAANGRAKIFFNQSEILNQQNFYVNKEVSIDVNGEVIRIISPQYMYLPTGIRLNYTTKGKNSHLT